MEEKDRSEEKKEKIQLLKDKILSDRKPDLTKIAKRKLKLIIVVLCISIIIVILALIFMLSLKEDYNKLDIDSNDDKNKNEESKEKEEKDDENKENNHNYPFPENEDLSFTEEEHRLFSREVAAQTMVLATNNGLPIESTDQVVLFGAGTIKTISGGTGSGVVYSKGTKKSLTPVMLIEGIENKIKENKNKFIYIKNEIGYEVGIEGLNGKNLTDSDIKNFANKGAEAKRSVAIFTISRISGEFSDRPHDNSINGTMLSKSEIETYESLKKYFDHIVVVVNVGSVIELNDMEKDKKTSILISFLPGMEAGNAIADILVGDINPSGHLTDTWAKRITDYPTTSTFIENDLYVKYKEGLFVGYRYFEEDKEKQSKVVFPFGHGLTYTTFDYENNCFFDSETNILTITSKVTNTGKRKGKQVIQVYVQKPQNENFAKVKRELIAFDKTKELNVGESETIIINFNVNSLASYDDTGVTGNQACYVMEKGNYDFFVGDSVAATRDEKNILCSYVHKELTVTEKLTNRLVPKDPEVVDANTIPDFDKLFTENDFDTFNEKQKVTIDFPPLLSQNNEEVIKRELYEEESNNVNDKEFFSILPTNKFAEINFKSVLEKKYTMDQLVDSMTNEELAFLSYGKPFLIEYEDSILGGLYNSGITGKYNIPYAKANDGPTGIRQSDQKFGSTAFPCPTALASSFDLNIIKKVGQEIGKEARYINSNIWLAPAINIHRNPLCGRNFEYYSEDPYLSGKVAASIIKGIQSKRVSATIKHFALNNKETNRGGDLDPNSLGSDSRAAERVIREIYLKGFEIAIKEANPWSIMTSYNRVNGMKTAESYDLLTGILREEWKYNGLIMTDWESRSSNDREAHAGNCVKMPINKDGTNTILNGLKQGTVTRKDLQRNILYLLNTIAKMSCIDSLYKEPKNLINITDSNMKIKIVDKWYRRYPGISFENCKDEDKGFNPTKTSSNSWISFYINNEKEQYRRFRIRYSSVSEGFGIAFNKYDETLGEISNLETTGGLQKWSTSAIATIKLPKGKYELSMRFLGYDYTSSPELNKGQVNWFEFL